MLAGITGVCAYALSTRLFPKRLSPDLFGGYRLSTPVGYWNGLGLLAAIAVLLAIGLAASERRAVERAAAAASLPLLLTTLYFTFSRGAWVALGAGLALALVLSPHRLRLVTAVGVLAPAPALTVWLASRSGALTHTGSSLASATHQGHRLAAWTLGFMALAALLALGLHHVAPRLRIDARTRRAYATVLVVAALGAAAAGLVAGGGPVHIARHAYDNFTSGPVSSGDLNQRLFNLSSNGRTELWHAAWREFDGHPALGTGAGTFEQYWYRHRPSRQNVRDAHNLYLQTLAELGVPGLVLLIAMLAVPFAGARARRHPLVPVALGAYAALLVHAAYDWDWQLPAVMLAGLFCGLAALVAARRDRSLDTLAGRRRALLLSAFGVGAAFAFVALVGNIAASRSRSALDSGHYAKAASHARTAADWAPWAARPWYLLGQAQAGLGADAAAAVSLRKAVANDPTDYRYRLGLSVVATGKERLDALAETFRLNPRLTP